MNSSRSSHGTEAFTLVELLCVIGIISIIAALLLPALNKSEARAKRVGCENDLRQTGIAFQIFTHDHDSKFPMTVSTNDGGSQEFVAAGYAVNGEFYFSYRNFQSLENEIGSPQILACPADTRLSAPNFAALQNSNLSYFVGVKASFQNPESILAGDRNLTASTATNPAILHGEADTRWSWTQELHQFKGNVLFADGHVEEWNNAALAAGTGSQLAEADLFMPVTKSDANYAAPTYAGYGNAYNASPGSGTLPPILPPMASTMAPPVSQPARLPDSSFEHRGGFSQMAVAPTGSQNTLVLARTNSTGTNSFSPDSGTIAAGRMDLPSQTFDQCVVKTLRRLILWTYLLVMLVFLVLLALKLWQRAQQKKERRENEL